MGKLHTFLAKLFDYGPSDNQQPPKKPNSMYMGTTNLVICTLQLKGRLYSIKDVRNKQQRVCKIQ